MIRKKIIAVLFFIIMCVGGIYTQGYADEVTVCDLKNEISEISFSTNFGRVSKEESSEDEVVLRKHFSLNAQNVHLTTEVDIKDGTHLEKRYCEEFEKSIVVLVDNDKNLLAVFDIPYLKSQNGEIFYADSVIEGNKITCHFESINAGDEICMVVTLRRYWTFYFFGRGYNDNSTTKHDFWMQPNYPAFYSDASTGADTLTLSWNAIDTEMRSYLTGSDRTKWINNPVTLYNQYKCHHNYSGDTYWNIEEWRPVVTWAQMIAAGCNPT